ncbi:hypothetical protein, partial [Xenorhabdus bovienii]|uniref:hypothetical protein n=1 Tax=Xenorhabdus bovienii TaxID=40576 RepID=UPI0023B2A664
FVAGNKHAVKTRPNLVTQVNRGGQGILGLQAQVINRWLAIDSKLVAIVNKKTGIFGEKGNLLSDLTHSIAMDVYPVFILRVASQRPILAMGNCALWR